MERLTKMTPKGAALKLDNPKTELEAREQLMDKYKIAVNKLAEYEDTGLTPQEVKELADAKELIEKMASYIMNTDIDELICKHTKCQDSCIKCVVDFFKSKLKEGDTE